MASLSCSLRSESCKSVVSSSCFACSSCARLSIRFSSSVLPYFTCWTRSLCRSSDALILASVAARWTCAIKTL